MTFSYRTSAFCTRIFNVLSLSIFLPCQFGKAGSRGEIGMIGIGGVQVKSEPSYGCQSPAVFVALHQDPAHFFAFHAYVVRPLDFWRVAGGRADSFDGSEGRDELDFLEVIAGRGLNKIDASRSRPGAATHSRPCRPLPAVCSSATTTNPCGAPSLARRAARSIVEDVRLTRTKRDSGTASLLLFPRSDFPACGKDPIVAQPKIRSGRQRKLGPYEYPRHRPRRINYRIPPHAAQEN